MSSSDRKGTETLLGFFSDLEDPRVNRTKLHPLINIVMIATLGVICGCEGWDELHHFGEIKLTFLSTFLDMRNGVPSADTIRRLFEALEPKAFAGSFERLVQALASAHAGQSLPSNKQIAVDGKTLRGSVNAAIDRTALHLVHAWYVEKSVLLGQVATSEKSNEITAIPALLAMLDLRNATVTIDAMGCQKEIAAAIVDKQGDYVLSLKDNHPTLRAEVEALFEEDRRKRTPTADAICEMSKGHGRTETRWVRTLTAPTALFERAEWKGIKSLACVSSVRIVDGERSEERRLYISSLESNALEIAAKIRNHWRVENELHWTLDVALREDDSRISAGNGSENFAMLRRVAVMLLKREKTIKMGIRAKQKAAGWSNDQLVRTLVAGMRDPDTLAMP